MLKVMPGKIEEGSMFLIIFIDSKTMMMMLVTMVSVDDKIR